MDRVYWSSTVVCRLFGLFMSWRSRWKGSVFLMFQNQSLKEVRALRCILSRVSAAWVFQVKKNSSLITKFRILFKIFPTSFIAMPSWQISQFCDTNEGVSKILIVMHTKMSDQSFGIPTFIFNTFSQIDIHVQLLVVQLWW